MEQGKMTALDHLRKAALRMWTQINQQLAELSKAVNDAVQELDREKQNRLTGTAGQVVGFAQDGSPAALDPPYATKEELDAAISGAIGRSY